MKNDFTKEAKELMERLFPQERIERMREYKVWYRGNGDELEQFYRNPESDINIDSETFSNTRQYFWGISSKEDSIKKTHSGLSGTIISVLNNVIGEPDIFVESQEENKNADLMETDRLHEILENSDFFNTLMQEQQPLTLVVGDGVWLPYIDKNFSDLPILKFIDGEYIDFEYTYSTITGINIKTYYAYENKQYMLLEKRTLENKIVNDKRKLSSVIKYNLFELNPAGEIKELVPLSTIPDTQGLEDLLLPDFDMLLGVPSIFWKEQSGRGKSVFHNKLDLLDDYDQAYSQASNVVRLSSPVEMISSSLFDRDEEGRAIIPKRYDRRFMVLKSELFDANGNSLIHTSQPNLNADIFTNQGSNVKDAILSGLISPATLGQDLARNSNALAQREKEKITMMTRNQIVDRQMSIISKVCKLVLKLDDYLNDREVKDYEIAVNYPEYANPSFDSKLELLSAILVQGGITEERYVDELWGDSLTEEQKLQEIEGLKKARQSMVSDEYDTLNLTRFEGDYEDDLGDE